jgi:glyoxylase-like metal-dependent hydrolase (beta-lactamase superfamily II)
MAIEKIDDGVSCIDLGFQGVPHVIAAYLLEDGGQRALIETGPTSTLDTLIAGLREIGVEPESISQLLVTHIHLDHAGAAGTWIRRFPEARLFVHEIGVPHMLNPEKLIASATRIYGDMMGPLWGEVEPVPEERITSLTDGDVVTVGRKQLAVLYTPGHASHHVVFHDQERDTVFTGDAAAVRMPGMRYVRPPTPPPDIDLDAWDRTLDRLRALRPRSINLTHFGPFTDVDRHLDEARRRLHAWGEIVRSAADAGQDKPEIVDRLALLGDRELGEETTEAETLRQYELATPYGMTVDGYLRYWRKRAAAQAR